MMKLDEEAVVIPCDVMQAVRVQHSGGARRRADGWVGCRLGNVVGDWRQSLNIRNE